MSYGTQVTLDGPFPEAVTRVRAALAAEGFGMLTQPWLRLAAVLAVLAR